MDHPTFGSATLKTFQLIASLAQLGILHPRDCMMRCSALATPTWTRMDPNEGPRNIRRPRVRFHWTGELLRFHSFGTIRVSPHYDSCSSLLFASFASAAKYQMHRHPSQVAKCILSLLKLIHTHTQTQTRARAPSQPQRRAMSCSRSIRRKPSAWERKRPNRGPGGPLDCEKETCARPED